MEKNDILFNRSLKRFYNEYKKFNDGVDKKGDNYNHVTHTDLDGVSCAIVSSRQFYDDQEYCWYTNKMAPRLYDEITGLIYEFIDTNLIDIYNLASIKTEKKKKTYWMLITDFGSITVDDLYNCVRVATEAIANSYVEEVDVCDIRKQFDIHFIVVDHHQSKYFNMNTEEINSSAEYEETHNNEPNFTVNHGDGITIVHADKKVDGGLMNVEMYLSTKYSAAKLLYNIAVETETFGSVTPTTTEFFDMVSTYDTGNMGEFVFDREFVANTAREEWIAQIKKDVSPQMILNAALYQFIDEAHEFKTHEYSEYLISEGINKYIHMVIDIFGSNHYVDAYVPEHNTYYCDHCKKFINPKPIYDLSLDINVATCPYCGATSLKTIYYDKYDTIPNSTKHVWKVLAKYAIKRLNKMITAYEHFVSMYEDLDITGTESAVYINCGSTRYGIKVPEGKKYRALVRWYSDAPDEAVSINVFAKKYMEYKNSKGQHYDLSITIYSDSTGTIKKCSLTQNPVDGADCYEIAALNGGGGHVGAAGFTITDISKVEVTDE